MAPTPEQIAAEEAKKNPPASTVPTTPASTTEDLISVPSNLLVKMQEDMAKMESELAAQKIQTELLADLAENGKEADTEGKPIIRKRKDLAPQFHTVRIRKFPIGGDVDNMGYVVGWTSRGAYQQVDRTGPNPINVDFIEIFFLGQERNAEGKLKAEKVKLLDLMNAEQVYCKILDVKKEVREVPTGEVIELQVYDPKRGIMQAQGETIDGYVAFTDYEYTIQIPGLSDKTVINGLYVN